MSETAVGLFERPDLEDQVGHNLDVSAYPWGNIRMIGEAREVLGDGLPSSRSPAVNGNLAVWLART
jgi:hypothetical protein